MRRRARVLAVAAAILASASSVARSDDALFRSLANPRIEGHEEALAAWENLEPSARLARIREGLRSRDPVVAGLAASLADPMALDLEELRRAMRLNAWDPNWVEHPGYAYGIPEIPAIARIAATTPGFTVVSWGRHCNFDVALDASAAAEIVPLLETPNGEVAWRLAEWLDRMAETTTRTETRPVLAQGFNYWRARRAAEESGRLVPPLASFVSDAKGRGVSPALEALVRGALADEAAEGGAIEDPWLMRWLWDVAPTTSDLPLLVDAVAARAKSPEIAGWAVRALAELDPRGEASGWHRLADGSDFAAVAAASESARLGRPERLRALQDAGGALADRAAIHAWETDPENARRRWLARAVAGSSAAAPRLDAAARVHYEHGLGVKIRDEDVARLGEALAENAIAARGVPRFLAATCPDAVSRPVAAAMAKRLAAPPAEDEEDETSTRPRSPASRRGPPAISRRSSWSARGRRPIRSRSPRSPALGTRRWSTRCSRRGASGGTGSPPWGASAIRASRRTCGRTPRATIPRSTPARLSPSRSGPPWTFSGRSSASMTTPCPTGTPASRQRANGSWPEISRRPSSR